jgi:hypothetical protein
VSLDSILLVLERAMEMPAALGSGGMTRHRYVKRKVVRENNIEKPLSCMATLDLHLLASLENGLPWETELEKG